MLPSVSNTDFQMDGLVSSRPRRRRVSQASMNDNTSDIHVCGDWVSDMKGDIKCKGCGYECTTGAELAEHAIEMEKQKVEETETVEQSKIVTKKAQLRNKKYNCPSSVSVRDRTNGEVHENSQKTKEVAMEKTKVTRELINTDNVNRPTPVVQPPNIVTNMTQQLLQQRQHLHQQQLVYQHQQQLLLLKQQQQESVSLLQHQQHLPNVQYQQLLPQQHAMSDRDKHIALLEQELRVQRMMLDVERREAMLKEQARQVTEQMERLKVEQIQMNRMSVPAPASGLFSPDKASSYRADRHGQFPMVPPERIQAEASEDEKAKLERMFLKMEEARKEELEKATIGNLQEEGDCVAGATGKGKLVEAFNRKRGDEYSAIVNNVKDDVISLEQTDIVEVQLKILNEIKLRNEEKKRHEMMNIKAIAELSVDETPYDLQNKVNDAANDSWSDLTRAVSGVATSSSNAVGGFETAKQKIARLKQIAERNGMSVAHKVREKSADGNLNDWMFTQNGNGHANGEVTQSCVTAKQNVTGNVKPQNRGSKKKDKLARERRKSEAMTELEFERKRAAEELKQRFAAQEIDDWERFGRKEAAGENKRRAKSGK